MMQRCQIDDKLANGRLVRAGGELFIHGEQKLNLVRWWKEPNAVRTIANYVFDSAKYNPTIISGHFSTLLEGPTWLSDRS
jgi:hypothetical protein